MIAVVEVGLCYERPPTVQAVRRVIVEAQTEAEAQSVAAQLVACREVVERKARTKPDQWEPTFPGVEMPVSTKIVELLAY